MITGEKGFLAQELLQHMKIPKDTIILMGSPTFDVVNITTEQSLKLHDYVKETMDIVDRNLDKYIIFASSDGVDDIKFDHTGSTSYSVAKLFLENYIINRCKNHLILRIGTILSDDIEKVRRMKPTRIQNQILNKRMRWMPALKEDYLMLDDFINETIEVIRQGKIGIHEYKLTEIKVTALLDIAK